MKRLAALLLALALVSGCRREMADQARTKPLAADSFFANGAAARVPPEHTVARGDLLTDTARNDNGELIDELPFPLTRGVIERGRERFEIHCSVCHGSTGAGDGMIVQRGFPKPPSLHLERLRIAPLGHFFEVMTRGYGVMYSYASRVEPNDRWAIAAYIRALQLSQHATLADAAPKARTKLEAMAK